MGSLVAILIIQKNDSADVRTAALSYWYLSELCSLAFNLFLLVWVLLLDGHLPLKLWDMIYLILSREKFVHSCMLSQMLQTYFVLESVFWK